MLLGSSSSREVRVKHLSFLQELQYARELYTKEQEAAAKAAKEFEEKMKQQQEQEKRLAEEREKRMKERR